MNQKLKIKNKFNKKTIYILREKDFILGVLPKKILSLLSLNIQLTENTNISIEISKNKKLLILEKIEKHAKKRLYDYLSYRERSENECYVFLENLPVQYNLADKLIQEVKKKNYINDSRYTKLMIIHYLNKFKSKKYILAKILEKRVLKSLIESKLEELYTETEENKILNYHIKKLKIKFKDLSSSKKKDKILSSLYRKGFPVYLVMEKLNI